MAFDAGLAERLRELFAGLPDVRERRMFGGLALISSTAYPIPREYYLTANLRF